MDTHTGASVHLWYTHIHTHAFTWIMDIYIHGHRNIDINMCASISISGLSTSLSIYIWWIYVYMYICMLVCLYICKYEDRSIEVLYVLFHYTCTNIYIVVDVYAVYIFACMIYIRTCLCYMFRLKRGWFGISVHQKNRAVAQFVCARLWAICEQIYRCV